MRDSVVFSPCNIFVWFWCQGKAGLLDCFQVWLLQIVSTKGFCMCIWGTYVWVSIGYRVRVSLLLHRIVLLFLVIVKTRKKKRKTWSATKECRVYYLKSKTRKVFYGDRGQDGVNLWKGGCSRYFICWSRGICIDVVLLCENPLGCTLAIRVLFIRLVTL